ncbi:MAG: hypothetical protein ACKE9I_02870 [Methylophagaceae bacterium]
MKPLEGTKNKNSIVTVVPAKESEVKTIVVLGVERGGTSMVAGMIRALGIDLGERTGRNHEDPRFLTDDQDKLIEQIQANNLSKNIWGFKVPKASLMLDFYEQHLVNPHYIIVFRNIAATIDSWNTRGGSSHSMQTAEHIMNYYHQALTALHGSKSPLIFANYERACIQPEDFAKELATFMGIEHDEVILQKAASIVTGDGGGYIDLPEYYFHIESLNLDNRPKEELAFKYVNGSDTHLQQGKKIVGDQVVIEVEDEFFPEEFLLGFELHTTDNMIILEQAIRIYMNFSGVFFPGHAFRPPIRNGWNIMKISTNGNVKQIALGGLSPGLNYGISKLMCYSTNNLNVAALESLQSNSYTAKPLPITVKIMRKLKRIFDTWG